MTKYRLTDDIDLTRHVRTPAGVAYFHKPIGSPIGGGASRAVEKVALKGGGQVAYMVNGKGYAASGKPTVRGSNPAADFLHQTVSVAPPAAPAVPFNTMAHLKPVGPSKTPKAVPQEHLDVTQARTWYDTITKDDTDADNLSTDLGLDPKLKERSIPELRKAIKDKRTRDEDRKRYKAEFAKRIAMQKAIEDEKAGFTNKLARRFEDAPEGADIAPIIGETLAEHPRLGPLAHVWDRLRLAGYNAKKHITSKEFGDELPRVLARSAVNILIALLAIHFGVGIPGLMPGGGDG